MGSIPLIIGLIVYKRLQYSRHTLRPFYAAGKTGFLVSANGGLKDCDRLGWEDVRSRLKAKNGGWKYGADVIRDFGIPLEFKAGRELYAESTEGRFI